MTAKLSAYSRTEKEIIVIYMANDDNLFLAERVLGGDMAAKTDVE